MKSATFILVILLAAASLSFGQNQRDQPLSTTASAAEKEEWERIQKRFREHYQRFTGSLWTLTHAYRSKAEVDRSFTLITPMAVALESKDPISVRKFNGPNGFKQQLVNLMQSRDDAVSMFAVRTLAILGDQSYAPQIAKLLDRRSEGLLKPVPGQAAVSLALLDARAYAPRIALLLKSENDYDRRGAAQALGLLKATEYADEVANLLKRKFVLDDDSAIDALFEMGVAANYKNEIAEVLNDKIPGERAVTAAYALAHLKASEHAAAIARLLPEKYKKGDAAKALALLGAKEYIQALVPLLSDEESFNRQDGALALGILGARQHASAIARLLGDEEPWVRLAAAQSLVLLGVRENVTRILSVLSERKAGEYYNVEDFHVLVSPDVEKLNRQFQTELTSLKAFERSNPPPRP